MAKLSIRSIHHFAVSNQDAACAALWPELIAQDEALDQDKALDLDFALAFIERFQATQMTQHPTVAFNDSAGTEWHAQAFSTPEAPDDRSRAMVVYSTKDQNGDFRPQKMTVGDHLNFVMFYSMTCCSTATASSVLGFEYEGQFEMLCSDAASGIKEHMHGLFMPGTIDVTRANAQQFDEPARMALRG